ncbi:uncharacterized protein LOC143212288 [Lasioglossum baleicum]|uniref:uncharacterized protein LOC143212288 n=1 Tax=Lasioglossum baleicum TaxID=434251 RepID=UPI003FCE95B5
MSNFLSTKVVGCIGKCTSGLTPKDLDRITDNIHTTLDDTEGIKVFARYLEKRELTDNINCLRLYETCCKCIDAAEKCRESIKEQSLEVLIGHVTEVREMAEDLDGVTQIDLALMEKYNKALNSKSKADLLAVLEDTRYRCREHLRNIHGSFKEYASQPCPLRK